jgi:hypothetical protein
MIPHSPKEVFESDPKPQPIEDSFSYHTTFTGYSGRTVPETKRMSGDIESIIKFLTDKEY